MGVNMPDHIYAIGVDLGGTKIEVGLVDETGKIHKKLRVPTEAQGGFSVVQSQIISAVNEIRGGLSDSIVGVGIGVAGQIEKDTGVVNFAPNLNWHNVHLKENLEQALQTKIIVLNDVRAATWGEWLYGAGKGCDNLVCLFVGTGVGGGIVVDNNLLTGCCNSFGEIGHIVVDWHGSTCTCGNRGCLESLVGGWAIAKRAQEAIHTYAEAGQCLLQIAEGNIEKVTGKVVVQAAQAGDPLALLLLEQIKLGLIAGCVSIVNLFNPCRLILGGGFMDGAQELIPSIEIGVKQRALGSAVSCLEVIPAQLIGGEAGVVGAAAVAIQDFKGNKVV